MKRFVIGMGVVAAMLFAASSALAANVTLAWNNCLSDGGASNRTSACTSNSGSNVMIGSFTLDSDMPGVTGIEVVIDLISAGTLPAWWEYFTAGTCRQTSLSSNAVISPAAVNCVDWSNAGALGGVAAYQSSPAPSDWGISPADEPAHRRIKLGYATATPTDIPANQDNFAFNLIVNNAKTVGTGACAGCLTPVCIVFNSCNVVAGTSSNVKISNGTGPVGTNAVTWQGGAGADCQAVPTRNATWGQVKSLYR